MNVQDAAAAKVSMYGGAVVAVYGGLTVTEWAAVAGAVFAFFGFIVTVIMAIRKDARDERIARWQMRNDDEI